MTGQDVGPACTYLMDAPHWRLTRAHGFPAFFRALYLVVPGTGFVALAAGAWPRKIRDSLNDISVDPGTSARQRVPREFRQAICIPMGEMATLAALAEQSAEPEIAIHIAAFIDNGSLVEWFDAPNDPLAVSPSVLPEQVLRFSSELGTTHEWVAARG